MDELTPEQEEAVAASAGDIQRIAMALVALPKEQRAAHYTLVRASTWATLVDGQSHRSRRLCAVTD
jgi:hypothetical protein